MRGGEYDTHTHIHRETPANLEISEIRSECATERSRQSLVHNWFDDLLSVVFDNTVHVAVALFCRCGFNNLLPQVVADVVFASIVKYIRDFPSISTEASPYIHWVQKFVLHSTAIFGQKNHNQPSDRFSKHPTCLFDGGVFLFWGACCQVEIFTDSP